MGKELSIIIPSRNNHEQLPALLESIARQSLNGIETVIVDDCSHTPYDAVVAPFRAMGMDIVLLRAENQIFTKQARLWGLSVAEADIVTFADADDILYGNTALEENVRIFRSSGADLLHFPIVTAVDGKLHLSRIWDPPCSELSGQAIFEVFAQRFMGYNVCGKLFRRDLWLQLADTAKISGAHTHCEDMYLFFLYAFHAEHYVSTDIPGYLYKCASNHDVCRALPRLQELADILANFVPYLQNHSCPKKLVDLFTSEIQSHMAMQATRLAKNLHESGQEGKKLMSDLLKGHSPNQLARLLVTANGIMEGMLAQMTGATRKF